MAWEIAGHQLILSGRCSIREVENLRLGLIADPGAARLEIHGLAVEFVDTPFLQLLCTACRGGRLRLVDWSEVAARRARLLGLEYLLRETD